MAETVDELKIRIRELEKEVAQWKSKVKEVRYGLNWLDVPEAFDKKSEDKIPILEEVPEKAIDAEGPLSDNPTHVLIEGDNYHVLTCLNYTHRGKIDVIYIDPPYNTGSDGFTYKDKRFLTEFPDGQKVPKEHPLRHSYWLSFMEKRLKLAKNLLSEKGFIFISIDDNEQANLKLLCDKVFGESNCVNQFVWKRNSSGKTEVDKFTVNTEYVLLYKKSNLCELNDAFKPLSPNSLKLYKYNDNDGRGIYQTVSLQKPKDPGPETTYDYIDNSGKVWSCPPKGWRMIFDKIKELENDGRLVLNGKTLREKDYWNERKNEGKRIDTLWNDLPENTAGTGQVSELFEDKPIFSNPKPIELIRRCLQIAKPNAVVLDFFAGSGTTLHSTIKLNREDGFSRQCIVVQEKEPTFEIVDGKEIPKKNVKDAYAMGLKYINDITYERNRRVMCGYTNARGDAVGGLGGHLKYYKTGFVGKHHSKTANDEDRIELSKKAGCLIALAENTLDSFTVPKSANGFWQIYTSNVETKKRYTCIYHNGDYERFSEFVDQIDELRKNDKKAKFAVYVFSWGSPDIFENEFDNLKNIEIKAIPKPILEIYKALN